MQLEHTLKHWKSTFSYLFSKKTKPVIGLCAENESGYWFQTTMLNRYRLLAIPEKLVPSPS